MAVFGAPVTLEDHAVRACLAALGLQQEAMRLAVDVRERDGIDLRLRVGLNSGEVIAGEIGSGQFGYAAVGEQVGMAQRMESVAPPGGVMLSASTAGLVEGAANWVSGSWFGSRVPSNRCPPVGCWAWPMGIAPSGVMSPIWLAGLGMAAVGGLLDRAIDGHGAVVGVVGSAGIGKSRLVREVAAMAAARGVGVFTAFCESHTIQVPFHAVARLLRAATGVEGLDGQTARDRVRDRCPDADPEDLLLRDDLLGGQSRGGPRRRSTRCAAAAVDGAGQFRVAGPHRTPAVYVIEDVHWIDEVSESLLAEFVTVIPQTPSLVLFTYRPEYRGALTRWPMRRASP